VLDDSLRAKGFFCNLDVLSGRVADPDPDSIRSVDPDPDSESVSGSRRAKMTHKSRNKFVSSCFEVLDTLWRPRDRKIAVFDQKIFFFFSVVIFFNFWSLKPWIRTDVHPKMLDPDPDELNADPQPCFQEA
jgi:hypothetical protein